MQSPTGPSASALDNGSFPEGFVHGSWLEASERENEGLRAQMDAVVQARKHLAVGAGKIIKSYKGKIDMLTLQVDFRNASAQNDKRIVDWQRGRIEELEKKVRELEGESKIASPTQASKKIEDLEEALQNTEIALRNRSTALEEEQTQRLALVATLGTEQKKKEELVRSCNRTISILSAELSSTRHKLRLTETSAGILGAEVVSEIAEKERLAEVVEGCGRQNAAVMGDLVAVQASLAHSVECIKAKDAWIEDLVEKVMLLRLLNDDAVARAEELETQNRSLRDDNRILRADGLELEGQNQAPLEEEQGHDGDEDGDRDVEYMAYESAEGDGEMDAEEEEGDGESAPLVADGGVEQRRWREYWDRMQRQEEEHAVSLFESGSESGWVRIYRYSSRRNSV